MSMLLAPGLLASGSAPPEITTWNPADKSANMALSNGDMQATVSVGGTSIGVRGTVFRSSGKFYFEGFLGTSVGFKFGLATTAWSLADGAAGGVGAVHYSNLQSIRHNGVQIQTDWPPAPTAGSIIRIAVDLDANLIWVALNGGSWNGTSADPEAGTGGAAFTDGAYAPSFSAAGLNQYMVLNTGASAFAYTPPAGFTEWDG